MTYPEAQRYLDSFINYEKRESYGYKQAFKLERMKRLASAFGDPQDHIKSVHIAGSKGKGSTAAIIHSILKETGFRTGLYTSPHLTSFRERIRINDSLISEGDIAGFMGRIRDVIESLEGERPSFFEVITMLAYLYFKEKKADAAVYETGLGGRLDATNIIRPMVSVITPISYEHTDKLGATLKEIAAEKGGIIKDNAVCVSAPQNEEAAEVIEKICLDKRTRLIRVGKEIFFEELGVNALMQEFSVKGLLGEYPALKTRLLGSHQVINAASAIATVEALSFSGITVRSDAIRKGVESAKWPGRLEVVSSKPLTILDGAHNRASANVLALSVNRIFKHRNLILVFGVSKDKDVKGILAELLPISDSVVLTKSKVAERALEPDKIIKLIREYEGLEGIRRGERIRVCVTANIEEALTRARGLAGPEDLILITGSLFLVGEARNIYVKD